MPSGAHYRSVTAHARLGAPSCRGDACPQLHHLQHVCLLRPQAGQPSAPVLLFVVIEKPQQQRPGAQPRNLQQAGGMASQRGRGGGKQAWLKQTIEHAGSCRCQVSCSRAALVQTDAARADSSGEAAARAHSGPTTPCPTYRQEALDPGLQAAAMLMVLHAHHLPHQAAQKLHILSPAGRQGRAGAGKGGQRTRLARLAAAWALEGARYCTIVQQILRVCARRTLCRCPAACSHALMQAQQGDDVHQRVCCALRHQPDLQQGRRHEWQARVCGESHSCFC